MVSDEVCMWIGVFIMCVCVLVGKGHGGDVVSRQHCKGCNCKRSGCLKNYCECYEVQLRDLLIVIIQ